MFYRFMQETVVYLWLFYILNINPNIITVEMFKLPLLWKFHVASLSKKKINNNNNKKPQWTGNWIFIFSEIWDIWKYPV